MNQLNTSGNQHSEISGLFDSIKVAIDSISEQYLELDSATMGLCMGAIALEGDDLNKLDQLVGLLRDQAADLEESKALFNKTFKETVREYIGINIRRRNALAPVDSKAEVAL